MEPTLAEKAMEESRGRCITCGFFAKHGTPGYFEAELFERAEGRVFAHKDGTAIIETAPICFQLVAPLADDVVEEQKLGAKTREEAARLVLFKNRACPKYFPYRPGLSPQSHLGGLAMQEMEQRQYKFQEDMEKRRRQWEGQLEHDRRRFEIKVTALLAIITAAGVITPIVVAVLFR